MGEDRAKGQGSTTRRLVRGTLILAQVVLLFVAWHFFSDKVRVSPGPLIASHAKEPRLSDSEGCKICHGPRNGACTADTCAACHAEIQKQIAARTGFHGTLEGAVRDDCGRCHGEHQGADFAAVNLRSFLLAGVSEIAQYRHEKLDFHLTGAHASLSCEKCHPAAQVKVLEKGEKRFLGLSQDCTRCHDDVHKGSYGKDCQVCHGQEQKFDAVASFRHTAEFRLSGGHAGLTCVRCHAPGTDDAVSVLIGLRTPKAVRACVECHANPHGTGFLQAIGKVGRMAPRDTCTRCHSAEQKTWSGPVATLTRAQHAFAGFPLDAPHDKVACASCHQGFGKEFPMKDLEAYHRRYPGRSAADCKACHGDPHRSEFEVGAFRGKDCLTCHQPTTFSPSLFDVSFHDRSSFKLEGRHRKLNCSQCHEKKEAGVPPVYHGTPTDCRSCHKDPHGGQFNTAAYRGNDCRVCHSQDTFKPPTFTIAMHAKTSFPLTGAHLAISCVKCHAEAKPAVQGAVALQKFVGTPGKCSDCHADVHAGKFDIPGRPSTVNGRTDCARCHSTDRFSAFDSIGFDHALWTGFPLAGAHRKVDCAACHGRNPLDDKSGRTLGIAAGNKCQSCHTDPHAGQFGPTLTVSCTKCHVEEGTFKTLTFNHQKDSRFRLDEVHVKIACAQCHKPMAVDAKTTSVRYKPLGIQCADCHDPRTPREKP